MPIPSRNELYNTSHINFVEKLTDWPEPWMQLSLKDFRVVQKVIGQAENYGSELILLIN